VTEAVVLITVAALEEEELGKKEMYSEWSPAKKGREKREKKMDKPRFLNAPVG
jgi:hypothetical protein